jgi:hypothetical protein
MPRIRMLVIVGRDEIEGYEAVCGAIKKERSYSELMQLKERLLK